MTSVPILNKPHWTGVVTVNGKSIRPRQQGFTLIEILVVVMLISLMAAMVVPVVSHSVDMARESALKENLQVIRKALDDYLADTGRYPESLDDLVKRRYIRFIPEDPVLDESASAWAASYVEYADGSRGVQNIRSTSQAEADDGSRFDSW